MNNAVQGVVGSHGDLAGALVGAVMKITGEDGDLRAISNSKCSAESLAERVAEAVGTKPTVVFVDLPSGSCIQAAARQMRALPNVAVVTGVNLAMLIDFVYHRDSTTPAKAADRAVDKGIHAIKPFAE